MMKETTELGFKGKIKFGQNREFVSKVGITSNLGNSDQASLTGSQGKCLEKINIRSLIETILWRNVNTRLVGLHLIWLALQSP